MVPCMFTECVALNAPTSNVAPVPTVKAPLTITILAVASLPIVSIPDTP